eukprot:scaffold52085_cov40-Phaeocystis_antarctica.AAC.1
MMVERAPGWEGISHCARPLLTKCRARVRVRVNCGATWSSYPSSCETKRASRNAGARVPPRPPCRRRPAL